MKIKKKRLLFSILSVVVAAVLTVGCGSSGAPGNTETNAEGGGSSGKTVTVGVLLPFTGSNQKFGLDSLAGLQLEADLINNSGGIKSMGGAKIKLVSRDATSDPSKAAAAMQQLISTVHPVAVIGVYSSGLTITAAPIAEKARVPLLTTAFADQLSNSGYKYVFQISPVATAVGKAQLTYTLEIAKSLGKTVKNVAVVYENDEFGSKSAEGIKTAAKAAGLNVVLDEGYSVNITDATGLANKIAAAHPDVIFPVSYLNDGILLMRALKAAGIHIPVVAGVGGFVTPDFLKLAGPDIVNGVFSTDISSPDAYGDFGAEFEKKYNMFMSQAAHDTAVALSLIKEALEEKPTTDPSVLAETLHNKDFTSGLATQMPGGHIKFSEQGKNLVIKPLMVQWQNGRLVSVWPSDMAKSKPVWP